jgi:hypothetical protein
MNPFDLRYLLALHDKKQQRCKIPKPLPCKP